MQTTIYLNTWGAYNNGSIGYGWMTPTEAREFIERNPERDGGEWFTADIDCDYGEAFEGMNFDYAPVDTILDIMEIMDEMDEDERNEIIAIMEYANCTIEDAIDKKDKYIIYSDIDSYYDSCDEAIQCELDSNSIVSRYFDFDAYHRDCMFDAYEASNGVVLVA